MKQGTIKDHMFCLAKKTLEKIAEKKANSNCAGFMYEPKKPQKLVNNKVKK